MKIIKKKKTKDIRNAKRKKKEKEGEKKKKLKKKKKKNEKTHTYGSAPSVRLKPPTVRACGTVPRVPDTRAVVVLNAAGMGDGGGRPECTKWVP
jgi:hypothetical protein